MSDINTDKVAPKRILFNWLVSAVALWLVSQIVPGFHINGLGSALLAVVVIGLVNATIGILLKVLTLPLTIVTLGIFWWVINALMLWVASSFVPGFVIPGYAACRVRYYLRDGAPPIRTKMSPLTSNKT